MKILKNLPAFHIKVCLQLTVCICTLDSMSLWQDVDIDLKKSNQETLLEAGSLSLITESLPSPEVPSLYTRIRSLHKLKVRLISAFIIGSSSILICAYHIYFQNKPSIKRVQFLCLGSFLLLMYADKNILFFLL